MSHIKLTKQDFDNNLIVPVPEVGTVIIGIDLNGNLISEYSSATAAAKENGTSVWKVLAGTNQTHKQYVYKYI